VRRVACPLSDEERESLSKSYNGRVDDVAEILASLLDASEDAERSLEDTPLARRVVRNLRERIKAAAAGEIAERTNDLTVRLARLQR
jgi:hypothetical protein